MLAVLLLTHYTFNISSAYAQNSTSNETSNHTSSEDAQSQADENTGYESSSANSTSAESSPVPSNNTEASQDDTVDAIYNNTSSEPEDQGQASATTNSTSSDSKSEVQPSENVSNNTQTSSNSNQTQTTGNSTFTANESMNSTDTGQPSRNSTASSAGQSYETGQQSANTTKTSSNYQNATSSDAASQESAQAVNSSQTMNENITSNSNSTTAMNSTLFQNQTSLPPPDFDIDMDPVTANIEAGSMTTFTITITSTNGFNSNVLLVIESVSPEILVSLSSNMTKPPVNASVTSIMTVQSNADTPSGKYKVKVAASYANITDSRAVSAIIEVTGNSNQTSEPEFDPVALTPMLIKNLQDDIINDMSSNEMVLLSTTLVNNYDRIQPFVAIIEVREKSSQATLMLQLQKGVLNPSGQVEVATSWMPDNVGVYEIRAFAINKLDDPKTLSAIIGKTIVIEVIGESDHDIVASSQLG